MTTEYYSLDLDDIKINLKTFFKTQTEFLDYNFEGSAISDIMNVLAYITQYQAFYLNQTVNELTMANAELLTNVKKLSNMLNYLPKRNSAPYKTITLKMSQGTLIIPKYSNWIMGTLNLINSEEIIINDTNNHTITLYEGTPTTEYFYSDGSELQKYSLSNTHTIDNTFFNVYVDSSDGSGGYILNTTAWLNVNKDTYDLNSNGFYIDYFDTFIIKFDTGRNFNMPINGDRIRVEYILTHGTTFNGTSGSISLIDDIANKEYLTITSTGSLSNGTDAETVDEIKLHAPLYYATQNRAVTEADYLTLINSWSYYNILHSANIWGGEKEFIVSLGSSEIVEDSEFRDVGYIYFSALKSDLDYIETSEWDDLSNFLSSYKFINIFFKFLDPTFITVAPTVNIKYQSLVGVTEDIETLTNTYLSSLKGYNKSFYLSDLIRFVDALETVIYTSITYTTYCVVRHEDYKIIRLNGEITPSSISGTINSKAITDDGEGNLSWNEGTVGSINYTTGFIILDTTFGGLSSGTPYDISFSYTDKSHISVIRESFLNFDGIILETI